MLDSTERKLKRVKINLMRNPKFALWSGILMVGKTEVCDKTKTASTNGYDEKYGRDFINLLDEKELAFVVLHEALHKAFRHLTTWKKLHDEHHKLANMACDYVINAMLIDLDPQGANIVMPVDRKTGKQMGLYDPKYRGMNAKQVFDALKEQGGAEHGEANGDDGAGLDDHDWDGAHELSEEEREAAAKEIDQAIRQGQIAHTKIHGRGKGGLPIELEELLHPEVDWREQLREFVNSVCRGHDSSSWRRVNRRFIGNDIYMPTLVSERVHRVLIGTDTSGSCYDAIPKFLSEVKSIADDVRPEMLDLLYWDGAVEKHEQYTEATMANIVSSTTPMGGGGTDPTCVMHYMKENGIKPDCVIMLTDGYFGSWGNEWEVPVLWAIVDNKSAVAPVGKTIHFKD